MVSVPVNTQNKPVEYLTRKFAINHNLPTFEFNMLISFRVCLARYFPSIF